MTLTVQSVLNQSRDKLGFAEVLTGQEGVKVPSFGNRLLFSHFGVRSHSASQCQSQRNFSRGR